MSRSLLRIVACGLFPIAASAQESAPKRTRVGPAIESSERTPPRVRGIVRIDDGSPFEGWAEVRLLGQGLRGARWAYLKSGVFDLPVEGGSGSFAWVIRAYGHDPVQGSVELRPDQVSDLGEVSPRRGSGVIEGRVTDLGGLPVSGAYVRVTGRLAPVASKPGQPETSTRTNREGRFRFERIPAGSGYVEVGAPGLAAIPARLVEMRPGESPWLDLAPVVGTLGLSVRGERGPWAEAFFLRLVDRDQRLRIDLPIEPPGIGVGASDGIGRGRAIRCGFSGSPRAIRLEPAPPGEALLPKANPPAFRNVEDQTRVEVLPDGALVRNVPAGTWEASVTTSVELRSDEGSVRVRRFPASTADEVTAEPSRIEIFPGGHARLAIRLP